jgi:predicted TPR repeat methyltransferase
MLDGPVPRALDVGCVALQSAIALKEIATSIVATDISAKMLDQATRKEELL